ncbi:putative mariner [Trichonephila clavata]|uniref:Putative mariner n=1 Tax=Trichonephila clavata TaxID=2740835 RepID=A0A8X6I1I6_TRICU|nr:putative mariner [Trichonephila clavata]
MKPVLNCLDTPTDITLYTRPMKTHVIMTTQLNQSDITVWGGISCDGVMSPVFFDGTIDCPRYLDMLIEVVVLQLQARPDSAELFFQQDGPHRIILWSSVNTCIRHWMERRRSIEWPPRFSDLTLIECFFWGVVRDKRFYPENPTQNNSFLI